MTIQEDIALLRGEAMNSAAAQDALARMLDDAEAVAVDRDVTMDGRGFEDLRHAGLLWYINRVAFHPRGYALALHFPEATDDPQGPPSGWSILGDGKEPWQYASEPTENGSFESFEQTLMEARIKWEEARS